MGGDTTRSVERVILCDLEAGGGPGGGGGSGMPGSHLAVEDPRERDEVGVLIAPADAALREAGGRTFGAPSSSDDGVSIEIGTGRGLEAGISLASSTGALDASGAGRLVKEERLNIDGGLSPVPALARVFGGGGKA